VIEGHLEEVHLESSTLCSARCKFCVHSDMKRHGTMPFSLFQKVVDNAVDLGCIHYTPFRVNEPLIFADFLLWMAYFRKKNCRVVLFTNASHLNDYMAKSLIDYSDIIHSITFSFHGGNKAVYQEQMGLNFDSVKNNITNFMGMEHNIECHVFCMRRSAIVESEESFMKLWDDLPFKSVGIRSTFEWAGDKPDELTHFNSRKQEGEITRVPCSRILRQLDVNYDGYVPLCCVDGHGKVIFGNLKEISIEEIWNNPLRRYYRDMHNAGRSGELPLCADCGMNVQ